PLHNHTQLLLFDWTHHLRTGFDIEFLNEKIPIRLAQRQPVSCNIVRDLRQAGKDFVLCREWLYENHGGPWEFLALDILPVKYSFIRHGWLDRKAYAPADWVYPGGRIEHAHTRPGLIDLLGRYLDRCHRRASDFLYDRDHSLLLFRCYPHPRAERGFLIQG